MLDSTYMSEFTFQQEWVAKRGLLLVLAFFLGGLGGGLYLVSLHFNFTAGMVTAFFIVAIGKGGSHLLFLGRPWRFWRAFLRPQTSWITRGIIAVSGFILFVGLQLLPAIPWFSWVPWTAQNSVIQALAIISAIVLIAYTGFALGVLNAIPIWNSAVMPLLFIVYSLLGGAGLTLGLVLGMNGGTAGPDIHSLEAIIRWLMAAAILILGVYLWISYYMNPTARYSVVQMLKGRVAPYFIGGVVLLGIVIPLSVTSLALFYTLPHTLILMSVVCELIGGFSLRYSILKAGVYAPLL